MFLSAKTHKNSPLNTADNNIYTAVTTIHKCFFSILCQEIKIECFIGYCYLFIAFKIISNTNEKS